MQFPKQNITKDSDKGFTTEKKSFTVVCRGSCLSLAQAEIFKQKVAIQFPFLTIKVIIRETAGDKNQSTPLHLVEGKDFFTKDIQDFLATGQADFALHSMKDVSGEDFFKQHHYAVIDRNDLRDVAIFNADIIDKIKAGKKIIMGTSSPRRSDMALSFLQKALPQTSNGMPVLEAIPIRGNVDIRLQKLSAQDPYDGIVLAAAGLNRLLQFEPSALTVKKLLADKKIMVLPLFECPPAAGQGAIVAETNAANKDAVYLLESIRDLGFHNAVQEERKIASRHGYGCSQQFGAFHIDSNSVSFTYAAGKNLEKDVFTEWDYVAATGEPAGNLFSSTDHMNAFFSYEFLEDSVLDDEAKAVFVSSHKAVHSPALAGQVSAKRVWAAGTRTWMELAKQGIWVEGSADGLGFEFIQQTLQSPLINIMPGDLLIITNTSSALHWLADDINAIGTYELLPALPLQLQNKIADADIIFWTSFQQYQQCKNLIKKQVKHFCLPGKTAR
jgi:hydroxymethylbilane synthase